MDLPEVIELRLQAVTQELLFLLMYPVKSDDQSRQPFTMNDLFDEQFQARSPDVTWLSGTNHQS